MTNQIEYIGRDGGIATLEGDKLSYLGSELAMRCGQSLPDLRLKPAVTYLANENCVDPRIQFLERCSEEHEPSQDIHQLASIYFGNDSEIANLALKRMLIGAVARAYNHGCSMSWLPILIGKQGAGKSGWAKGLVPREMFVELNSDLNTLIKEAYRLHQGWILELPEIDQLFKPQHAESLKNLITLQVDEIRRPWELPTKAKRGFVFIGTSNQPELLVDSTGNRRFVPIRIADGFEVPWRELEHKRGGLWAAATALYKAGEPWEYSTGQLAQLASYQDAFMERDAWFGAIYSYISDKEHVTTADILANAIELSVSNINNGHQRRCGRVMRTLGFEQSPRRINGKSTRVWIRTKKAAALKENLSDF
ncbi:virulence-associated E family protein [Synechococcus sp. AH-224-G16]|nr:virulence-associated E family protein [Synechococcus sp. AH-224-G16]